MTIINIVRDDSGKINGLSQKDKKAYASFRKRIEALDYGELATIEFTFPRNSRFHRKHFAMLGQVFDMQEQFDDFEQFRMWTQIGAGCAMFVSNPSGDIWWTIPNSISFAKMDEQDFEEHNKKVREFLYSERARQYLWDHMDDSESYEMMESLLMGFE